VRYDQTNIYTELLDGKRSIPVHSLIAHLLIDILTHPRLTTPIEIVLYWEISSIRRLIYIQYIISAIGSIAHFQWVIVPIFTKICNYIKII